MDYKPPWLKDLSANLVMYIIRILNTSLTFLLEAAYYFILLHNASFIIFGPA